ncbi:MAG: prepilin-type N-terminal cleavage/methylation domain-containing protein [Gallionella sp.]|jgi:prepilin-type N-terminal cleavage/methylation domain-containing protein
MKHISVTRSRVAGFTLVEMAIVLAIVALILGASLTLLSAQQDQRRIEDTRALLSDAQEALIGFALSHSAADLRPYLACPDKTIAAGEGAANDGQEDRTAATGACITQEGNLPWVTLGLTPQTDPWSNRLRYRVTDIFSNSHTGMLLTSNGDLNVRDAVAGNLLATAVPAVILSHGKNGLGAINAAGIGNPAPPGADELGNTDISTTFVSHTLAPAGAAGGEFDDQVVWLSPDILFNRMVQAGKLP